LFCKTSPFPLFLLCPFSCRCVLTQTPSNMSMRNRSSIPPHVLQYPPNPQNPAATDVSAVRKKNVMQLQKSFVCLRHYFTPCLKLLYTMEASTLTPFPKLLLFTNSTADTAELEQTFAKLLRLTESSSRRSPNSFRGRYWGATSRATRRCSRKLAGTREALRRDRQSG